MYLSASTVLLGQSSNMSLEYHKLDHMHIHTLVIFEPSGHKEKTCTSCQEKMHSESVKGGLSQTTSSIWWKTNSIISTMQSVIFVFAVLHVGWNIYAMIYICNSSLIIRCLETRWSCCARFTLFGALFALCWAPLGADVACLVALVEELVPVGQPLSLFLLCLRHLKHAAHEKGSKAFGWFKTLFRLTRHLQSYLRLISEQKLRFSIDTSY